MSSSKSRYALLNQSTGQQLGAGYTVGFPSGVASTDGNDGGTGTQTAAAATAILYLR